jgi:hypothetical protein
MLVESKKEETVTTEDETFQAEFYWKTPAVIFTRKRLGDGSGI